MSRSNATNTHIRMHKTPWTLPSELKPLNDKNKQTHTPMPTIWARAEAITVSCIVVYLLSMLGVVFGDVSSCDRHDGEKKNTDAIGLVLGLAGTACVVKLTNWTGNTVLNKIIG